jgi:DNA-binding Xre family transcriptional regulator
VIRVRLRELMRRRERAKGERVTYEALAKKTGLSRATVEAIGSRASYNPRISTIERLCAALDCTPGELLDYSPANPRLRPRGRR